MSGSLEVTAFTTAKGPLLDHDPRRVLDEFDKDVRKAVADRGAEILKAWPFKGARGGGFQANIHVKEEAAAARIPGPMIRGVTWAPWLEGTSQRNRSTKFPGYHLFKKTAEQIQDEAAGIADEVLQKYLPKLGGE